MKITKTQLKQIIKEELNEITEPQAHSTMLYSFVLDRLVDLLEVVQSEPGFSDEALTEIAEVLEPLGSAYVEYDPRRNKMVPIASKARGEQSIK